MPIHREKRVIPYSQEQFFDIIADVERYPEYLSFWQSARIERRVDNVYHTVQQIGIGPVRERFRTQTRLSRPTLIVISSADPLFKAFEIRWGFESLSEHSCRVDFEFKCEMASFLMRRVMDLMLDETARAMVGAFEDRARELLHPAYNATLK